MAKKQEINVPFVGMNREAAVKNLQPQEYIFAKNVVFQNELGNTTTLTTEQSNLLSSKFKSGYKVVGFRNDITTNASYFLLTNPDTGNSEIGRIKDNQTLPSLGDTIEQVGCTDCDISVKLSNPLEEQTQVETQIYETLLDDSCNKCLGLSIYYPIKKHNIVIKNEKCGHVLYFTDGRGPFRYVQLDNLSIYSYTGSDVCGVDNTESTCLDCDKLRVFPLHSEAKIIPSEIVLGGKLKLGSYEFLIAYSDNLGNELTEYSAITNPIHIFDLNDNILSQEDLAKDTNFAIKLNIQGLDTNFKYYKIAVIQTASLDGAPRYFVEGIHPITDDTVLYTTDAGKDTISLNRLLLVKPNVISFKGITQANNYLFGYGIEAEKEWNLQPVVNLMGSFLKWQTHITTEDYYKDGINSSYGKGYMRDEVYPFSIRFITNTGYKTALFPLVGRPSTISDLEVINNTDEASVNSVGSLCGISTRNERWKLYNTATVEEDCILPGTVVTNTVNQEFTKTCLIENAANAPADSFNIDDVENFVSLEETINEILEGGGFCTGFPFCNYLDIVTTPDCTPTFDNCDTPVLEEEFFEVNTISGETLTNVYTDFPEDYLSLKYSGSIEPYKRDNEGEILFQEGTESTYLRDPIYSYSFSNTRATYAEALTIQSTGNLELPTGYFHQRLTNTTLASVTETNFIATCTANFNNGNPAYRTNIAKQGLWFEIDLNEYKDFVVEVTKLNNKNNFKLTFSVLGGTATINEINIDVSRISFFSNKSSGTSIYCETYNKDKGTQILISYNGTTLNFYKDDDNPAVASLAHSGSKLYFVIDAPIDFVEGFYKVYPLLGSIGVGIRAKEVDYITASYTNISFNKVQKYSAFCDLEVPVVEACSLIANKKGSFSYWESSEEYPDNSELYNSKTLVIKASDFYDTGVATEFSDKFSTGIDGEGNYILSNDTDFRCKPIRHFKFPDNSVAPFMYENPQPGFSASLIYPLGVTIDENIINDFLNIAVNNNVITQEQRDSVISYEIFRGDRILNKSIIAKGLLYDMYSYIEDNKQVHYSNYPYNDLGEDSLFFNENRTSLIQHPNNGESNNKFTFHSPDTEFLKPTLPTELKVEGYMFGNSRGAFDEVEGHSKWVILGKKSYRLASTLATAEVISESALNVAMAYGGNNLFFGGVVTGGNFAGIVFASIAAGLQIFSAVLFRYGRYKYEWQKTFENLGQPENFAYYYSSEGYYNYLRTLQTEGNSLRGLNVVEYLKDGRKILIDRIGGDKIEINNLKREESVFISTGTNYAIQYPDEYKEYDNGDSNRSANSKFYLSQNLNCKEGRSEEIQRNIASPYVSLKSYLISQYGTIDSIKWLTTSYVGSLINPVADCNPIFGGDVYISRHTLKRKVPMFIRNAYDIADKEPFNYKYYSNLGTEPRFYCNYKVSDEVNLDRVFPEISSEYTFDCTTGDRGFYVKPPTKFYLYYYGIPSFLVESEINLNYRYGKTLPEENFYPNVGDYLEWTQENTVSIKERNRYFYNFTYSKPVTTSIFRTLPSTYNKEEYDCRYDEPNGTMYSLQDNSENDLYDPWLIFRPLDRYSFSSSYGDLIEMRGIENEQVLARFTNTTVVFNAVDSTSDDGTNPELIDLGNGAIFARRPRTFSITDLGKWGSQSSEMSSNEFGHFYVDAKRGSIIRLMPASQGIKEISKYGAQGRVNGMFNWFKEHLPFKILTSTITNYENINIDNPYNGVGITIGYDDRYKRVFFTKKDYVPKVAMYYQDNKYYLSADDTEVSLTDSNYFDDVSWTIGYDAISEAWISYYDFKPNYYVDHNNYFQTGINVSGDEFGLWSHNLTNKSYRVFYGKKYPSIVEYSTKNNLIETGLNNISFKSDAKRYHSDYNIAYDRNITWNKAIVYSSRENSGVLNLIPQKTFSQISKYPITNKDNTQDILITNSNELWSFDYIYNRVKSEVNNQPHLLFDKNHIEKTVNFKAVSFLGKKILESLSSTSFNVHLEFTGDTRYEVDLQWALNQNDE